MNRFLLSAIAAFILLVVTVLIFRESLEDFAYDQVTEDMFVEGDTDGFDPGPAIGSRFPGVTALYQGEPISLIEPFAGPNGTVFMASRSFDWCPYCMKQLIQLNGIADKFAIAGIGLVAITYDPPELQAAFAKKHGITIPMLSDIDALSFKTLGILNEEYQPWDDHYGIPYPGTILIDPHGVVVGKLFLESYKSRVSAEAVLAYARKALAGSYEFARVDTVPKESRLSTWKSGSKAGASQRSTSFAASSYQLFSL
jgi:peroxiredoxin